jgi:hypothetical protein
MNTHRALVGGVISMFCLAVPMPVDAAAPPTPLPDQLADAQTVVSTDHSGRRVIVEGEVIDGRRQLHRWDRLTGATSAIPDFRAVSADGSAIITADGAWTDLDTGLVVAVPERADFTAFVLTSDGATYVAGGPIGTNGWVVAAATQARTMVPVVGVPVAISADGRFVLVQSACRTLATGRTACDTRRWDRTLGTVDLVTRQSLAETLVSGVADTGRVVVSTASGIDRTIVARDVGGARHDMGVFPGVVDGTISDDGQVYLARWQAPLGGAVATAIDVEAAEAIGSLSVSGAGSALAGPTSVQLTGDGAQLVYLHREDVAGAGLTLRVQHLVGRQSAPRLHGGEVLPLSVAGHAGVGADATSVMLNVTVTNPAAAGFLTVWPCGQPRPLASNANFVAGQSVAVAVLAGVGSGGSVCVASNVDTDVVLDVQGWFGEDSPYHPITPARVADTRNGDDDLAANLPERQQLAVDVATAGVPSDAPAAMLSVTVTNPAQAGYLTVWPCGEPQPLASNVNFVGRQTTANAVLAMRGAGGEVCIASNVAVDVVVDVQGWLVAGDAYTGIVPARVVDTRLGEDDTVANVAAGGQVTLQLPPSMGAAMLNVTVTNPSAGGYLTVWPCGQPRPLASNLNFVSGQTIANAVLATPGSSNNTCLQSNVDVDVVIDLQGNFAAAAPYHALLPVRLLDTRD